MSKLGCGRVSPILINLFINDFAMSVKALGKDVKIDDEEVCIMMYANDIVLLADNENDLQSMLNLLDSWYSLNHMVINPIKSQIVHFRPRSIPCTNFTFTCGSKELVDKCVYMYLGITLSEFLDFNVTAKMVSQAAGRAFDLLIAKYKTLGGMPFDVYCK